jgi:Uma2 family endonuclease
MSVKVATYEQVALEDPQSKWELVEGALRKKPPMTMEHNRGGFELAFAIRSQVSDADFDVRSDSGRLRFAGSYFIPDVFVVPAPTAAQFEGSAALEAYAEPVPFVAEVWSPSTGDYDVTQKLAAYQARGDGEIWLVHPYERWVRAFVRLPDGSYDEHRYTRGHVAVRTLQGVVVEVERLFTRR